MGALSRQFYLLAIAWGGAINLGLLLFGGLHPWPNQVHAKEPMSCRALLSSAGQVEGQIWSRNSRGDNAAVFWSPDRERIALLDSDSVEIWNVRTGTGPMGMTWRFALPGAGPFSLAWAPNGERLALLQSPKAGDRQLHFAVVEGLALTGPGPAPEMKTQTVPLPAKKFTRTVVAQPHPRARTEATTSFIQWMPDGEHFAAVMPLKNILEIGHFAFPYQKTWEARSSGREVALVFAAENLDLTAALGFENEPGWGLQEIYWPRAGEASSPRLTATFFHEQFDNVRTESWDLKNSQKTIESANLSGELATDLDRHWVPVWASDQWTLTAPQQHNGEAVLAQPVSGRSYWIKRSPVPNPDGPVSWGLDLIRFRRQTVDAQPYQQILLADVPGEFEENRLKYYIIKNGRTLIVRETGGRLWVWNKGQNGGVTLAADTFQLQLPFMILIRQGDERDQRLVQVYSLDPYGITGYAELDNDEDVLGVAPDLSLVLRKGDNPPYQKPLKGVVDRN